MNAPLSRRALLGATAAVGAVTLPTMWSAGMPEAKPLDADTVLLGLIARHRETAAAWKAACRHLEQARDRAWAAYPPRPAALTATSFDLLHGLAPSGRSYKPDGRAWIFFNLDDLDRLRVAEPIMSMVLDEDGHSVRPVPNPVAEARRREVVETYDRWLADRAAVDDRLGLTAAEAVEGRLCIAMDEAEAAVEAYLPTTLAGVRAKSVWVLGQCDCADAALAFLRQIAGEAAPPIEDEDGGDVQVAA